MDYENVTYLLDAAVLSMVAGVPLLLAAGCCLPALRKTMRRLLPWAPVPALLTGFLVPEEVVVQVPWFFMGSRMGLDGTGRVFLCVAAFIWLLAALSIDDRVGGKAEYSRFSGYFLAAMAGNFGLILAREMLGFYLFFALMSFASYGLIVHHGTPDARRAGRIYLILVVISELAMFTALVSLAGGSHDMIGIDGGSFSLTTLLLLFAAFGVKVGALPFHRWMPLSYQAAPVAGATALAGAMVNAGILGWLRFIPLGQTVSPEGGPLFIGLGAVAAFYGVFFGLTRMRIGEVLAASSISQMGLVTLIAGAGLLSRPAGEYAAGLLILYAVHHSLAKGSLFLGYCLFQRGIRPPAPILLAGLLLPSLSLAGMPFTSGAVVKTGFKELAVLAGGPWYAAGKYFLPASSLGTTVLMLHCVRLFRGERREGETVVGSGPARLWVVGLVAVVSVFWLWPAAAELRNHALESGVFLQSCWPVAAGLLLAFGWFRFRRQYREPLPPVFEKIGVAERAAGFFVDRGRWLSGRLNTISIAPLERWFHLATDSPLAGRLRKSEKVMGRWSMVGLSYLCICLLLLAILLL